MQMLYNSDNFAVLQFEVPTATADAATRMNRSKNRSASAGTAGTLGFLSRSAKNAATSANSSHEFGAASVRL